MSRPAWIVGPLLAAAVPTQDLADGLPAQSTDLWALVRRLQARVDALEAERGTQGAASDPAIDLSGEELPSIGDGLREHVLARPWYENVRISGYLAATFLETGGEGTAPDGSFLVKEASLFVEADIWEDTRIFSEVILARFPGTGGVRVGELNLQFTRLFASDGGKGLGLKLGRFEIPFGEEYLRWDAHETPFITFSAADPYGVDEGVELYSDLGDVHWIAALTNGSDGSGADDDSARLVALKVYAQAAPDVYLSASALAGGDAEMGALRLSGNAPAPVGTDGVSTAGVSPSASIAANCWELNARFFEERRAGIGLNLGGAEIDDVEPFDRDLLWWQVLPRFELTDRLEAFLRYSEIRTDDSEEGYRFSGKPVAMGEDLGYDVHSLRRASAALRWTFNPHVAFKLEIGHDWLDLIDASPLQANDDERLFFGLEVVGSF